MDLYSLPCNFTYIDLYGLMRSLVPWFCGLGPPPGNLVRVFSPLFDAWGEWYFGAQAPQLNGPV